MSLFPEKLPSAQSENQVESLRDLSKEFPEFYKIFVESEIERVSYKRNEHAYRRYLEKKIIEKMEHKVPASMDLELSILFKAKSFLSGDFCYADRYVDDKYLVWLGDAISHGTGSKIVKDIINDTIMQVFKYFRSKKDYNLQAFNYRLQMMFSSKKVLDQVMEADLSDILSHNDFHSKMGIVIPMIFVQMEAIQEKIRVRTINRGMPLMMVIRPSDDEKSIESIHVYTNKDGFEYKGENSDKITVHNQSTVPLILDKSLFSAYTSGQLKRAGKKTSYENILETVFPMSEFYAEKGDLICIPSDGCSEIINNDGEEYGLNRLVDDLVNFIVNSGKYDRPLHEFKELYYYNTLRKFTVFNEKYPMTGNGIEDDMTMLFIRVPR